MKPDGFALDHLQYPCFLIPHRCRAISKSHLPTRQIPTLSRDSHPHPSRLINPDPSTTVSYIKHSPAKPFFPLFPSLTILYLIPPLISCETTRQLTYRIQPLPFPSLASHHPSRRKQWYVPSSHCTESKKKDEGDEENGLTR